MIQVVDIYWAAGFLEGEGWFGASGKSKSPVLATVQVQKEPMERLVSLFGGKLHRREPKTENSNPFWEWRLCGSKAVGVMLTLWTIMSPKRKSSIEKVISEWNPRRIDLMRRFGVCKHHGSDFVRHRQSGAKKGSPYCLECAKYYNGRRYH